MNRRYTKFQPHADNAMERVQGDHLNKIQDAINDAQVDITDVYSRNFLDDSLFILENNPYINMMFFIDFATQDDIFRAKSMNYFHDVDNHCVIANADIATVHTIAYKSDFGNVINNFMLKADADIPVGSIIKYYISLDMKNYYPIKAGESTPLDLGTLGEQVYVKIEIIRNRKSESPRLYSVALYYRDELLEQSNSIKNPSLTPLPIDTTIRQGDTIIIYDPATGRVKKILEPDGSSIDMVYDDSPTGKGRLLKTVNTSGVAVHEEELIYGTYTNPNGVVVPVLKGIRTNIIQDVSDEEDGGGTT